MEVEQVARAEPVEAAVDLEVRVAGYEGAEGGVACLGGFFGGAFAVGEGGGGREVAGAHAHEFHRFFGVVVVVRGVGVAVVVVVPRG